MKQGEQKKNGEKLLFGRHCDMNMDRERYCDAECERNFCGAKTRTKTDQKKKNFIYNALVDGGRSQTKSYVYV